MYKQNLRKPQLSIDISNDKELAYAVDLIEGALLSVSNYLKQHPRKNVRIRFPKDEMHNVKYFKPLVNWVPTRRMKDKISSQFVYLELLSWIERHTDLKTTERFLLHKDIIIVSTAITEAVITLACEVNGVNLEKYKNRVSSLRNNGYISEKLCSDACKQWDLRGRIHLASNRNEEIYTRKEAKDSVRTAHQVVLSLAKKF